MDTRTIAARLSEITVLVVDDEPYMRKVVRTMLMGFGVRNTYEAADGPEGLELIRSLNPDVVIVDWQMPGLNGAGFARMVRSPQTFPYPNVPMIMLTGHSERSRVLEAVKAGVNEFLLKPVSSKALQDRLIAVLSNHRKMVQANDYYGPMPRNLAAVYTDEKRSAKLAVTKPVYYVS